MISEERYDFTPTAKKRLITLFIVGIILTIIGFFTIGSGDGESHSEVGHDIHSATPHGESDQIDSGVSNELASQNNDHVSQESKDHHDEEPYGDENIEESSLDEKHEKSDEHGQGEVMYSQYNDDHHGDGGHHGASPTKKRFLSNLWINSIFFGGLSIIGVFFFSIQYAAQAGWSAGLKRIPFAFGSWLPIAFLTLLGVFLYGGHDLFHWTHAELYMGPEPDEIMQGKASYFFFPLEAGSFPLFWVARLVIFFLVWYLFFRKLRSLAFSEDLEGGTRKWYQLRSTSAIFLVFFAVSSSMAAWDWVMSVDPHWFSTMFGWYVFASWWVSGLALSLFLVLFLKDKGLLSVVNENHIHDMGKFVFAFSIFWTYVWFSQFLLIYYAHIPEETIYFVERWKNDHYAPVFFINLILNFFLPFLLLMTRDSKRHSRILKVITSIVVFGHWIDFYLMISPGTVGENGGFGFMELGIILVYLSAFLFVVLNALAKAPLFAKNHPMLQESLQHHI